jgi:hypothetical protein
MIRHFIAMRLKTQVLNGRAGQNKAKYFVMQLNVFAQLNPDMASILPCKRRLTKK